MSKPDSYTSGMSLVGPTSTGHDIYRGSPSNMTGGAGKARGLTPGGASLYQPVAGMSMGMQFASSSYDNQGFAAKMHKDGMEAFSAVPQMDLYTGKNRARKVLEHDGGILPIANKLNQGSNPNNVSETSMIRSPPLRDTGKSPVAQASVSGLPFVEHHLKQLRAQCLVLLAFRNGLMPKKRHLEIALGNFFPKEGTRKRKKSAPSKGVVRAVKGPVEIDSDDDNATDLSVSIPETPLKRLWKDVGSSLLQPQSTRPSTRQFVQRQAQAKISHIFEGGSSKTAIPSKPTMQSPVADLESSTAVDSSDSTNEPIKEETPELVSAPRPTSESDLKTSGQSSAPTSVSELLARIQKASGSRLSTPQPVHTESLIDLPTINRSKQILSSTFRDSIGRLFGLGLTLFKSALEVVLKAEGTRLTSIDRQAAYRFMHSLSHRAQSFHKVQADVQEYNHFAADKALKERECNKSAKELSLVESDLNRLAEEERDLMACLEENRQQKQKQAAKRDALMSAATMVLTDLEELNARTESMLALKSATDSDYALLTESVDQLRAILHPLLPSLASQGRLKKVMRQAQATRKKLRPRLG